MPTTPMVTQDLMDHTVQHPKLLEYMGVPGVTLQTPEEILPISQIAVPEVAVKVRLMDLPAPQDLLEPLEPLDLTPLC